MSYFVLGSSGLASRVRVYFVTVGYHFAFLRVLKPHKEYNFHCLILSQPRTSLGFEKLGCGSSCCCAQAGEVQVSAKP